MNTSIVSPAEDRDLWWEEDDRRTYRQPTQEELHEALGAERKRQEMLAHILRLTKELEEMSKHPSKVFYDQAGYPYDLRIYIASGNSELI